MDTRIGDRSSPPSGYSEQTWPNIQMCTWCTKCSEANIVRNKKDMYYFASKINKIDFVSTILKLQRHIGYHTKFPDT